MFDDKNGKYVIQEAHRRIDNDVRRILAEESAMKTAELMDVLVDATKRAEQRAIEAEKTSDEAISISRKANAIAIISIVVASLFALLTLTISII